MWNLAIFSAACALVAFYAIIFTDRGGLPRWARPFALAAFIFPAVTVIGGVLKIMQWSL